MRKNNNEDGQGLVEYALVLVLVAVIVMAVLSMLGGRVALVYAQVMAGFNGDSLDDGAIMLSGAMNVTETSGVCNGTLENIKFVVLDADGNTVTDQSVSATVYVNGDIGNTFTGTADKNGIATAAGPVNISGKCPLTITLSN